MYFLIADLKCRKIWEISRQLFVGKYRVYTVLIKLCYILQVYNLIFGSYPDGPDSLRARRSLPNPEIQQLLEQYMTKNFTSDVFRSAIANLLPHLSNGFLMQIMEEPALMQDKKLIGFLFQLIGQSDNLDYPVALSPREIAEILKV